MTRNPEWEVRAFNWEGDRGMWVGEKLYERLDKAEELVAKLLKTETGRKAIAEVTKPSGLQYWDVVMKERWAHG